MKKLKKISYLALLFAGMNVYAAEAPNKTLLIDQEFNGSAASTVSIKIGSLDTNHYSSTIKTNAKLIQNPTEVLGGVTPAQLDSMIYVDYNSYGSKYPNLVSSVGADALYRADVDTKMPNIATLLGTNVRKWMVTNNIDSLIYNMKQKLYEDANIIKWGLQTVTMLAESAQPIYAKTAVVIQHKVAAAAVSNGHYAVIPKQKMLYVPSGYNLGETQANAFLGWSMTPGNIIPVDDTGMPTGGALTTISTAYDPPYYFPGRDPALDAAIAAANGTDASGNIVGTPTGVYQPALDMQFGFKCVMDKFYDPACNTVSSFHPVSSANYPNIAALISRNNLDKAFVTYYMPADIDLKTSGTKLSNGDNLMVKDWTPTITRNTHSAARKVYVNTRYATRKYEVTYSHGSGDQIQYTHHTHEPYCEESLTYDSAPTILYETVDLSHEFLAAEDWHTVSTDYSNIRWNLYYYIVMAQENSMNKWYVLSTKKKNLIYDQGPVSASNSLINKNVSLSDVAGLVSPYALPGFEESKFANRIASPFNNTKVGTAYVSDFFFNEKQIIDNTVTNANKSGTGLVMPTSATGFYNGGTPTGNEKYDSLTETVAGNLILNNIIMDVTKIGPKGVLPSNFVGLSNYIAATDGASVANAVSMVVEKRTQVATSDENGGMWPEAATNFCLYAGAQTTPINRSFDKTIYKITRKFDTAAGSPCSSQGPFIPNNTFLAPNTGNTPPYSSTTPILANLCSDLVNSTPPVGPTVNVDFTSLLNTASTIAKPMSNSNTPFVTIYRDDVIRTEQNINYTVTEDSIFKITSWQGASFTINARTGDTIWAGSVHWNGNRYSCGLGVKLNDQLVYDAGGDSAMCWDAFGSQWINMIGSGDGLGQILGQFVYTKGFYDEEWIVPKTSNYVMVSTFGNSTYSFNQGDTIRTGTSHWNGNRYGCGLGIWRNGTLIYDSGPDSAMCWDSFNSQMGLIVEIK
jgi:hypothetical protein